MSTLDRYFWLPVRYGFSDSILLPSLQHSLTILGIKKKLGRFHSCVKSWGEITPARFLLSVLFCLVSSTLYWPSIGKIFFTYDYAQYKTLLLPWLPEHLPPLTCVLRLMVCFYKFLDDRIEDPQPCSNIVKSSNYRFALCPRKCDLNVG